MGESLYMYRNTTRNHEAEDMDARPFKRTRVRTSAPMASKEAVRASLQIESLTACWGSNANAEKDD